MTGPPFGVYRFELTPEEARAVAGRTALRAAMAARPLTAGIAPIFAFLAMLIGASTLAWAGLIGARAAEIAVLGLIMIYGAWRGAGMIPLRRAYRAQRRRAEALGRAGLLTAAVDAEMVKLSAAASFGAWRYADCVDADLADGILYLWRANGDAAVLPTRAAPPGEAESMLAFWREHVGRSENQPPLPASAGRGSG